jgi:nucleotide-binding universal stress UspA family protein
MSKQTVLWAIDPFERARETRSSVISFLKRFSKATKAEIEPVYVLSPSSIEIETDLGQPGAERYIRATHSALREVAKSSGIPGLRPPRVLTEDGTSLAASVRSLARYAETSGASMIAVGSHGRKGLSRLLLGSFAESLVIESRVPVVVVGPEGTRRTLDRVLFATDFSDASAKAFDRVVELTRSMGATLVIFHAIAHPVEPVFQSGVYLASGGWVPTSEYLSQREAEKNREGEKWKARAARRGVRAEFVCDQSRAGVTQAVLDAAHDAGAGLIAMAGESGPVTAALVGSITRQVVRRSRVPVWVFRDHPAKARKKAA